MNETKMDRQWQTIEIPAKEFNARLNQFSENQTFFSRLSLIHQAAKSFAAEAVSSAYDIDIEEITDPPLYGYTPDDEPVIIRFSY